MGDPNDRKDQHQSADAVRDDEFNALDALAGSDGAIAAAVEDGAGDLVERADQGKAL